MNSARRNPLTRSNPHSPAIPVLAALRAATAERHVEIDRCMPLSRVNPTHVDYIEHLRLMRAWLEPLESVLDSSPRAQIALIDADMAAAGIPSPQSTTAKPATFWRSDAHASYRWGARYVIEGSRLGAAVLYGRLRVSLQPLELHFLRGDSGVLADRWPRFLRQIGSAVCARAEIDNACAGACDCFDSLLSLSAAQSAP